MALNLDDINKEKKLFPKKKKQDASEDNDAAKKRPWKDFTKEQDLLDLIAQKKKKKKVGIKKEFKKNSFGEQEKERRKQKQVELEENKRPGITEELKKKIKSVSKQYFSDIN